MKAQVTDLHQHFDKLRYKSQTCAGIVILSKKWRHKSQTCAII